MCVIALRVELQMVAITMWGLGIKLGAVLRRAANPLNLEPSLQSLNLYFIYSFEVQKVGANPVSG